jgi:hypothetical protein
MMRFLKKKNGDRVLQEYSMSKQEYVDVEMFDEEIAPSQELYTALRDRDSKVMGKKIVILAGPEFLHRLHAENYELSPSGYLKQYNSFMGNELLLVSSLGNKFKLVVEV